MIIDGKNLGYIEINEMIKNLDKEEIILENLDGKRYIGNKIKNKKLIIKGNLGSKAGKELEETEISLHGNCEDAIGDSMKSGKIIVEGNCGDAAIEVHITITTILHTVINNDVPNDLTKSSLSKAIL